MPHQIEMEEKNILVLVKFSFWIFEVLDVEKVVVNWFLFLVEHFLLVLGQNKILKFFFGGVSNFSLSYESSSWVEIRLHTE